MNVSKQIDESRILKFEKSASNFQCSTDFKKKVSFLPNFRKGKEIHLLSASKSFTQKSDLNRVISFLKR